MVLINSEHCKTLPTPLMLAMSLSAAGDTPDSDLAVGRLTADQLSCTRGERNLFEGLSFNVSAGECLHVVGANGCGKTSLLRIICGITQPDKGAIYWNNNNIAGHDAYFAESSYIAHKDGLKNELTAIENLRWYQSLATPKLARARNEDALDDCLESLGILDCADLFAQQLSFGQRRRLAFSRLLLASFKLWILDEPFTGVDVTGRASIEGHCVNHLEQGGSIIMTHHQSLKTSDLSPYLSELNLPLQATKPTPENHEGASE